MEKILSVYKPAGMTPLQLIKELRNKYPEYKNIKIGYAGRLDPLAHGLMLLTAGDENKNRNQYLSLNKTYKFSVLFGVQTDSYDYLGLLLSTKPSVTPPGLNEKIADFISKNTGILNQTYPPFSSKTINGVPLYKLAKKDKLKSVKLPSREVEIFDFHLESIKSVNSAEIKSQILNSLKKVTGHFRQKKAIALWEELFKSYTNGKFKMAAFTLDCSSGTYVRSLANEMGKELGCGSIAFEICRTKVGEYKVEDALRIIT